MINKIDLNILKSSLDDFEVVYYDGASTMDYAQNNEIKKDTLVISATQPLGKGRNNKTFISKEGGLYMSLVLLRKPKNSYAIMSALAVSDALFSFGVDNLIKWPNDIICNDKKICGILIKVNPSKEIINIGIGVNINNDISEISNIATSLKALGFSLKREDLALRITKSLVQIEKQDFKSVILRYKSICRDILLNQASDIDTEGFLIDLDGNRRLNPIES